MAKKKKNSNTQAVPAMDKDWQAEGDADTLVRSQEILADKSRKQSAMSVLRGKEQAVGKAAKMCSSGSGMAEYMKKAKK